MSVKVTNTGRKEIGLGGLIIKPDETAALPDGFGLEHPTVNFLVNRGWLTKVTSGGVVVPPGANIGGAPEEDDAIAAGDATGEGNPGGIPAGNGDSGDDDKVDPGETNDKNAADSADGSVGAAPLSRRDIERMGLADLRNEAARRNLEFSSNAPRAVLIELITADMAKTDAENGGQE